MSSKLLAKPANGVAFETGHSFNCGGMTIGGFSCKVSASICNKFKLNIVVSYTVKCMSLCMEGINYQIKSNHLFESGDMAHTQALTYTHTIHSNIEEGK